MGLKADMQAVFTAMRVAGFADAVVTVRHEGNEYTAISASVTQTEEISHRGQLQNADGAFRLNASELKNPEPQAGDLISISSDGGVTWKTRSIISARFDQLRATMRVDYEAQYA